jgi:hypothetical protein
MKHTLIAIILLFTLVDSSQSQDKTAAKFAQTITQSDLRSYLSILASDSLEGRETGERGQRMAADFIMTHFKSIGLEPPVGVGESRSYYQKYPLKKLTYRTSYLRKGDSVMKNTEDFLYYTQSETKGEEYVDILFLGNTPLTSYSENELEGKYLALSFGDLSNWRKTLADLEELDVEGVIMIIEDERSYDFIVQRYKGSRTGTRMATEIDNSDGKIIIGNPRLASWIFGKPYEVLKRKHVGLTSKVIFMADMLLEDLKVENVLGYIEGSEKPEELLILTAHYDHIGISDNGQINNGADDDGSGTSSLMEIAQAFTEATKKGHRPKRSILFMAVSGEEKGLLGSKYYTEHPVFPLENTVTNLNIDMIGRVDKKHESNPNYVYVIGSDKLSQDLHQLSERVNQENLKLEFDYTYNDEHDPNRYYYRSDHYNFAKKGVPIIFYFNGTHPDYHRPTDTIEKIHFEKMEKIARTVFLTAWEIVNRETRIKLDSEI